ncbi:MAG TPA: hypothetical protein VK177_08230 [Flavobacteriales bacterium]|nr:hypothetical protein [Flavobacteriales bacterium]
MKTTLKLIVITTLAVLVSLNGICQLPTVQATSQGWAGGVCCRSGINYSVTLTGKKGTLDDFKVSSVCIGGLQFESAQINVRITDAGDKTIVYLHMGTSHNDTEYRPDGIKEETFKQGTCSDMQVNYSTGRKRQTVIIEKVDELEFLAYP